MKLIKNKLVGIFFLLGMVPLYGNIFSKVSSKMQNLNAAVLSKSKDEYPELDKFKKKYACPVDQQIDIDSLRLFSNNSQATTKSGLGHNENIKTFTVNGLSDKKIDFFDKGPGIGRIVNAQKLQKYLQEQGLNNQFGIAEESIYQQGSDFTIISKGIELGDQNQKISLAELQGMIKIAKDTGYWDWQLGSNLLRDKHGKLIFVDTEDVGFYTGVVRMQSDVLIDRIEDLCFNFRDQINDEALNWAKEEYELNYLKFVFGLPANAQQIAKYGKVQCLLHNKVYDGAAGVNIDRLKAEFRKSQRRKKPIQAR